MSLLLTGRPGKGFRETAFFQPRSVWFRADPELPESAVLARNLAAGGFHGQLMGDGFATPEGTPDLAVLCVRPEAQATELARIAAMGCFVAIVPTAAPGLAAMAAQAGVQAVGERSFGLALPGIGLNATLSHLPIRPGKLALMAQSSAIARAVIDWAAAEGLGFSHIIGIGSNDGLGFASGLDWLARDTGTACVMLEIRRIKQRRFFVSAARAVARTRPVLALRAGGRMDDPSGIADGVMAAVLRRAGVLRAEGFEEWLAAAETLARTKPRGGAGQADRIAILANGLGVARLAADAALGHGLRLAEFSAATQAALGPLIPEGWEVRNPLSLGSRAGAGLAQAARLLAGAAEVDVVIALHAPEQDAAPIEAFATAARGNRGAPILLGWAGEASAQGERAALSEAGLPVFNTPEGVVRGAAHLAAERRNRATAAELPASDVLELTPDRPVVRALFAAVRAAGRLELFEDEALAVLAAYGIATLPPRICTTPTEAAVAAVALGPPVALKARALLRHKSEAGGVVLNLRHFDSVRAAAELMAEEVPRRAPGVAMAGFLVQRMARRGGMELRLRLAEDAMFGPWIGFGQGGTTAEIAADEALDLPPLNLSLAHGLIARTRLARLLPGFRDRPPVHEPAIADALVRISQLQVDFPEIAALDVNPLFADASGVLAADAAIRLRAAGEAALFAIPPYPAELVAGFTGRDGSLFEVRPIRPEDAAAQGAFFLELPPEDVRFRFFSTMKELPPAMLARLTQIDYGREMAFIATREGRNFGTARVIREGSGNAAEFAVVVSPAAKGTGLARHLMERAMDWARAEGITELVGHVLADNAPMQGFMRKLGFTLRRSLDDADIMLATKLL
ncbi:GNAT family N-acetyltransferase [Sediminicoccus sp. KRV36]|uniref:bifunctional acetate--CoA ligase family protein/GNAT family N-acetyltransferase n=1 Tax=Sediminicoccus sp. KRV36 TaxID=3133721 RepID=UPI00200E2E69|nr:GNAT family N-acetyltransferase [Sediminicoccus rosea]UPY35921.1 GNAT family N-acetyltransferase [Sediminicoccus rosea]